LKPDQLNTFVSCKWVAEKLIERCALDRVDISCPLTCEYGAACTASKLRFKFDFN